MNSQNAFQNYFGLNIHRRPTDDFICIHRKPGKKGHKRKKKGLKLVSRLRSDPLRNQIQRPVTQERLHRQEQTNIQTGFLTLTQWSVYLVENWSTVVFRKGLSRRRYRPHEPDWFDQIFLLSAKKRVEAWWKPVLRIIKKDRTTLDSWNEFRSREWIIKSVLSFLFWNNFNYNSTRLSFVVVALNGGQFVVSWSFSFSISFGVFAISLMQVLSLKFTYWRSSKSSSSPRPICLNWFSSRWSRWIFGVYWNKSLSSETSLLLLM